MTGCTANENEVEFKVTASVLRKQQIKALKLYCKTNRERYAKWKAGGYRHPPPVSMPFPEICRGMKCEAKTRSGRPCRNSGSDYGNGRCKYHGGASTGPVTPEGKKRVSMNSLKNKPHEVLRDVEEEQSITTA